VFASVTEVVDLPAWEGGSGRAELAAPSAVRHLLGLMPGLTKWGCNEVGYASAKAAPAPRPHPRGGRAAWSRTKSFVPQLEADFPSSLDDKGHDVSRGTCTSPKSGRWRPAR